MVGDVSSYPFPAGAALSEKLLAKMPPMDLPDGVSPAAVMMLLVGTEDAPEVVLTLRSSQLKRHAGQVSFPGGKPDTGDADLCATALRETEEEIGWPADKIDILGYLPLHLTGTNYLIQPVIGYSAVMPDDFIAMLTPQAAEVETVWTTPVLPLTNLQRYEHQHRDWQGQRRQFFTITDTDPVIWGATAGILRSFAQAVQSGYDEDSPLTPIHC